MFRTLLESSLANRWLVLALAAVLLALGSYQALRLPVDVFPDLNKPTVTVMAEAGGMAAEEVEQLVTFPLETSLNGLPGLTQVRSVSSAGLAFLYLTFDWDTEIYRARQMVSERLVQVAGNLPTEVQPKMGPVSSIMGEILLLALPIDPSHSSAMQVREYADWVLRPRLLALPGVAQVIPMGGEVRQFQVQPDVQRMKALGITLEQVETALRGVAGNASGGFLAVNGREYLIRHLARTAKLEDLQQLAITARDGRSVLLRQVAEVSFAPALKRGDAGFNGAPAVVLAVQKQPTADTVELTQRIEAALESMRPGLPPGIQAPIITFRQADFIEASIHNVQHKLWLASGMVAVVLWLFLGQWRSTLISLTALPLALLAAVLVFHWLGLSINTMTLGGLAIAIGELVDDAVVDVENVSRRLRLAEHSGQPFSLRSLIVAASLEVRSAIVYATVVIVLVFVPLFALPGMEGRLFTPLGVAYIVSILASMLVAMTLTPVLCFYLLPTRLGRRAMAHGDTPLVRWLKHHYARCLPVLLNRWRLRPLLLAMGGLLALAVVAVLTFPTTFLPPFNEGSLVIGLRLNPGVTLDASVRMAQQAETLIRQVPEVVHVGRRSGRAELDEHAEGVHVSELDVRLRESERGKEAILADIRRQLAPLPAAISVGQPISHRIDHMLSGVRAQIAVKIFGEDLDVLRGEAARLQQRLQAISGIADLEIEKQVLAPQLKVTLDYPALARYGVPVGAVLRDLQTLTEGSVLTQIVDGPRRFNLVLRLPDSQRQPDALGSVLIDTPSGRVPLSLLAQIDDSDGPNQIVREEGRRRIVLSANAQGRPLSEVVADIRRVVAEQPLPPGYFITLGGQFQAQESAARQIALLSVVSLALIFLVLYSRYRSALLAGLVMLNVPLALVGSVIGLWLSGQPLSVAALVGLVTLAGIATRNGILKISHYLNLMRHEGESFSVAMIVRGSLERLSPVLMTALVAALALSPLLLAAEQPGAEILHPVAVVVFSGLLGATLLDTFLTPLLFWRCAAAAAQRWQQQASEEVL